MELNSRSSLTGRGSTGTSSSATTLTTTTTTTTTTCTATSEHNSSHSHVNNSNSSKSEPRAVTYSLFPASPHRTGTNNHHLNQHPIAHGRAMNASTTASSTAHTLAHHTLAHAHTHTPHNSPPLPTSSSSKHNTSTSTPFVNPASIPERSSSYRAALTNSDSATASPAASSGKSPRRYRSLIDERDWMRRLATHSPSASMNTFAGADNTSNRKQSPPIGNHLITDGSSWNGEKENILKGPFVYLESHPGKDVRSQLINGFNAWLQVPDGSLQIITRVVAMLHTASLLIDDVEDNSQLRRGIPVAHSIFGTAQTINSANYVYFCALQELLTLNNPEVIRIYTDELLNLHRGQGMDLFWRDTLTCPTEDDYLEMVGNKTGGLFRLAIKLMCAESPSHQTNALRSQVDPSSSQNRAADYVPLVNTVGLLFQILDDYRNLSDTVYTQNKGLCEDLTEGKFSFPIIHAIRSDPTNLVLINILKQKTTDDEVKKYAVAYMERCGSFSYTRRVLRGLTKKALSLVDEVDAGQGKGEGVKSILERLRVDRHSRASHSA